MGADPTPEARGPMPVVVGCPRSGTTLLAVMLDSHPQIAMPPETAFLPELRVLAGKEGAALRRDFFILLTTDRWGVSNWNDIGIALADTDLLGIDAEALRGQLNVRRFVALAC